MRALAGRDMPSEVCTPATLRGNVVYYPSSLAQSQPASRGGSLPDRPRSRVASFLSEKGPSTSRL